ncbi:hypothetical protein PHYBLDRAFT_65557 [Phycomyces blakesleeanus NRRL 1555(-)]|uniref:FAR1 domain-containing protein n=1 Tax=Phycomyces blakesleeanus (strain ATCC 8743b / DSM 1359 / FGSC 10004 / NBRC 33097 / NRRL 1555) TaxID=763407 RepID=A0A162N9N1_PHYB8|nr:hypothetical protein PHYBLDRAFT_65557 [Phycomyces blakesleeanus NRRL 1555(-)]OAD72398.1 hypothetical protein PHYBLDRAFT_65557 [Phycomyces blakesleeanus NRRL 1555(-)]|eukprot:XP_018290438.1 hypothetical protein PHYBLDRAFT_65557 [Phycomyces blakesleeanus NRRL 1555(-)]
MNPINKEICFFNGKKHYPVQQPLPVSPANGYSDMTMAISKMQEYALANNFALVTRDSKPTRVYLKCAKGGHYKNTRNIEDSERKRIPSSGKTGCPYLLKISYKKAAKGYLLLKATNEIEGYHNHPLDDDCLESTLKGRLSKVTVDDAREIMKLVETKTKTREIQKAINEEDNVSHKLYVNDINNIKAAFALKATFLYEKIFYYHFAQKQVVPPKEGEVYAWRQFDECTKFGSNLVS